MTTLADEDIKTDELDLLALDRGYRYRIRPTGSLTNTLWVYTWEAFRPGRRGDSGPVFSLEEAVEKVNVAMTPVRCDECGSMNISCVRTEEWTGQKWEVSDLDYYCFDCGSTDVTDDSEADEPTGPGLFDPPKKEKQGPFDHLLEGRS
jgi:hypothetical protein